MAVLAYMLIECILFGSYITFATFYSFSTETTTTAIDSMNNVIITPAENDLELIYTCCNNFKTVSYIAKVSLSVSGQFMATKCMFCVFSMLSAIGRKTMLIN